MPLALTAGAAALALVAAGCGSDDNSSSSDASTSGGAKAGKVAVLLPDSKSSVRWETLDRPLLKAAFDKAGVESEIQNAEGDKSAQQQQAEQAITNGAKVLLLVNLDSGCGAAIAANAKSQGVKVIDYDRLTLKGDSDYYVSFDNEKVGKLQGQGLVDCLGNATKPAVAVLNGSPTDNNATLFAKGYNSVLDPKFKSGEWTKVDDQSVPDWDNQKALTIFEQMLQKSGNKIDGVARRQRRPRQRGDLGAEGAQAQADPGHRPGRDAAGHPEHRRRRPVHDRLQGDQEGGRRGRRAGEDARLGRDADRRHRQGQQRQQGRPVRPARAGRRHEGQHQGVPRRGRTSRSWRRSARASSPRSARRIGLS